MKVEALGLAIVLVPAEIEPIQPLINRVERNVGVALDIRVIDSKNNRPAIVPRVQPIEYESTGATDVEVTGRGRREANSH